MKEGLILCYKGSIEVLTDYIYHADSKRIIKRKDDGTHVSSSYVFTNDFGEIYQNQGAKIEIEKTDFDGLFDKCLEAEKSTIDALDLAKALFE